MKIIFHFLRWCGNFLHTEMWVALPQRNRRKKNTEREKNRNTGNPLRRSRKKSRASSLDPPWFFFLVVLVFPFYWVRESRGRRAGGNQNKKRVRDHRPPPWLNTSTLLHLPGQGKRRRVFFFSLSLPLFLCLDSWKTEDDGFSPSLRPSLSPPTVKYIKGEGKRKENGLIPEDTLFSPRFPN